MDDGGTHRARARFGAINALLSREPGYSVAKKCLEVQAAAEARDLTLRTEHSVRLSDDAWSWYVGAIGEQVVGGALSALGPEWMVRHAVPIGSGTKDIDHLVIGPTGVFAINTKHHSGAKIWVGDHVLRVNGANTRHLTSARSDAADVVGRLRSHTPFGVHVVPVLAMVGQASIIDGRREGRVHPVVIDSRRLLHWITSQSPQHSPTEIALIRLAAEEPATWHSDPTAAQTTRVMQRFDRLVSEVGAAPRPARVAPPPAPVARRPARAPAVAGSGPRVPSARLARRRVESRGRPLTKRELARRTRRTQGLVKLVVLGIAGLTAPAWLPSVVGALVSAMTGGPSGG